MKMTEYELLMVVIGIITLVLTALALGIQL